MKYVLGVIILIAVGYSSQAQDTKEKTMEKRAREMHRVICTDSREQWKVFVKQNYSQALIDKPMRVAVEDSESGSSGTTSSKPSTTDNLEAKASMFERLHEDFGSSKIISLKPAGDKIEMLLKSDSGLSGTFILKFTTDKPYLIDGLAIEAGD